MLLALVAGCQTTNYQAAEPTATPEAIESAKEYFAQERFQGMVSVSDQGVLKYSPKVPPNYRWESLALYAVGYEISCEFFREHLENGFTSEISFRGQGGRQLSYDAQRCIELDEKYAK